MEKFICFLTPRLLATPVPILTQKERDKRFVFNFHTLSWSHIFLECCLGRGKIVHTYLISCMIDDYHRYNLSRKSKNAGGSRKEMRISLSLSFLAWLTVIHWNEKLFPCLMNCFPLSLSLTSMWIRTLFDKLQEMPSCVCVFILYDWRSFTNHQHVKLFTWSTNCFHNTVFIFLKLLCRTVFT